MVVGPKATLFLDEISTGLDSSTTYLIVKCIRNFVHMGQVILSTLRHSSEHRFASASISEYRKKGCEFP
jgi:ABC-type multidrug transport system ATPase subunit